MKSTVAALLVGSLLHANGGAARANGNSLLVKAPAGPVTGIQVNGVDEWFGIPYAAPPLGNLRWRAPQPLPR
jgi:para-nitrobenzyl esterase